ncbi:hypothetical protein N7478_009993 [Penicillium angulare]|uniref:uncharacterized protein n=1 Tax=Penicillium angulare TaxID=116970 RepID=UPI00253FB062|nr:uncharacterized protein N7478_009993 [Penicillium angulare]KAJ5267185.1 hypothetical protein N7478_009993 [Penicillium angulare]
MESPAKDIYFLGRDKEETERLNKQHRFLLAVSDDRLIHLAIPTGNIAAVADIGTGTGICLEELAHILPTTKPLDLHGFDISSAQFPPGAEIIVSGKRPIPLTAHDALNKYPAEHQGRYDLVHIRLLVAGIKKEDYAIVLRNARDLLKPKGYIQWEEVDTLAFCTDQTPEYPLITYLRSVVIRGMEKVGFSIYAPRHVFEEVSKGGFRESQIVRLTTVGKEHLHDEARKWVGGIIRILVKRSLLVLGEVKSEEEADGEVEKLVQQFEEHAVEALPLVNLGVVVAQRDE